MTNTDVDLTMKTSFLISLFVFILFGCKKTEDPPDYKRQLMQILALLSERT